MKNMTLEHIAAVCGGTYIGNEADKTREIKGRSDRQPPCGKRLLIYPGTWRKGGRTQFHPICF